MSGRQLPAVTGKQVICASLHGEWARIHSFANGNGRTARLWANWAAQRGNHAPMVAAFRQMLIARLTAGSH